MSKKQVYAVLEFSDHELRLLVGEFVEGRLNILHKDRERVLGIVNNVIVKNNDVVATIIKLVARAQDNLNFKINRVLLSIPSINLTNKLKQVNVFIDSSDRRVSIDHIKKGVSELLDITNERTIPVNIGAIRYISNGIISRKMPLNEICELLTIKADVLYASQDIVYNYVMCVEEAGIEVMDICLESFSAAEETSIVRKMDTKYVIGVRIERSVTTLTLFEKDRILNSQITNVGYRDWIVKLVDDYELKPSDAFRLIKNAMPFNRDIADDEKVFTYQKKDGTQVVLSKYDVAKAIDSEVSAYFEYIKEVCGGIISAGDTRIVFYGEGSDFNGIEDVITNFEVETTNYIPDILGARESVFTSMLGMFYVWNEQKEFKDDYRSCTDEHTIHQTTTTTKKREELGITQRLKRVLTGR